MDKKEVTLIFMNKQIFIDLPKEIKELEKIINNQFQVRNYYILVDVEGKGQIELKLNQMNNQEFLSIRQQIKSRTKMNIIEISDTEQNPQQNQFYDMFIKNQRIICCSENDCLLCFGKGNALIDEEKDANIINEIVQQKLQQRLGDIQKILSKRTEEEIKNLEDFLKYHEKLQNEKLQKKKLPQNFQLQNQYSCQILSQLFISSEPQKTHYLKFYYQNNGETDWPKIVWLQSEQGPFAIRIPLQSLEENQSFEKTLGIFIPRLSPSRYTAVCSIRYKNNEIEGKIGNDFVLVVEVVGKKSEFQVQIENKLVDLGYDLNKHQERIQNIINSNKNKQWTIEEFFGQYQFD